MTQRATSGKASTGRRTVLLWTNQEPAHVTWAREARGFTRAQVAAAIGKGGPLITEIEAGTRNATPEVLRRIAEFLGCPVSMLERRVKPASRSNQAI